VAPTPCRRRAVFGRTCLERPSVFGRPCPERAKPCPVYFRDKVWASAPRLRGCTTGVERRYPRCSRAVGRAARRCTRAGRRPGAHSARPSWYHRRRVGRASGLIGRWRVIPHLAPVNGEAARTSAIHWAKTAMAATLRLIPITERARPKSMAGYTGAIVRFVSNAVIATRAPAAAPKRS